MIVVIGSPIAQPGGPRIAAAGAAGRCAIAAVRAGGTVQLIGRLGDDPAGDAVLIDLAEAGVGHVAILRDAAHPTPSAEDHETPDDDDDSVVGEGAGAPADPAVGDLARGLPLDAGDVDLGLRYLTDFSVVVVADELDDAALAVVVEAVGWASAHLVLITAADPAVTLPENATVLRRLDAGGDEGLATLAGRYAAALDRGETPAAAFAGLAEKV